MEKAVESKNSSLEQKAHIFSALKFAGLWTILYGAGLVGTAKLLERWGTYSSDPFPFSVAAVLLIPTSFGLSVAGEALAKKFWR